MTATTPLPLSLQLVLRDRTRADVDAVMLAVIGDLVADGVWCHSRRWSGLRRRHLLQRVDAQPLGADIPEPLRFVDGLLTRASDAPDVGGDVKRIAAWVGRNARGVGTTVVHKAIDQLVADALLTADWRPTPAGEEALANIPPRDRDEEALGLGGAGIAWGWDAASGIGGLWAAGHASGAVHHHSGHGAHHGGHDGGFGGGHHGGHDGGFGGHHGG
jgi:hypothetical protein